MLHPQNKDQQGALTHLPKPLLAGEEGNGPKKQLGMLAFVKPDPKVDSPISRRSISPRGALGRSPSPRAISPKKRGRAEVDISPKAHFPKVVLSSPRRVERSRSPDQQLETGPELKRKAEQMQGSAKKRRVASPQGSLISRIAGMIPALWKK